MSGTRRSPVDASLSFDLDKTTRRRSAELATKHNPASHRTDRRSTGSRAAASP
jgi:hypothetical protein